MPIINVRRGSAILGLAALLDYMLQQGESSPAPYSLLLNMHMYASVVYRVKVGRVADFVFFGMEGQCGSCCRDFVPIL